jgi:hypothetical protein
VFYVAARSVEVTRQRPGQPLCAAGLEANFAPGAGASRLGLNVPGATPAQRSGERASAISGVG